MATEIILKSRFVEEFDVIHIDTADRRPLENLGRFDIPNICLAITHYCVLLLKLVTCKVDLVYIPISQTTRGFLRDIPFVFMSKLFRKKVVLHLRGGYFREFYNSCNGILKSLISASLRHSDRMIVLGGSLRRLFDGLMPDDKVSVVPNGIDLVADKEWPRNHGKDCPVVLFLSNLIEAKGFYDVLLSVKIVKRRHRKMKYTFAGVWIEDKDRKRCGEYIKTKKICDHVEFKGSVTGWAKTKLLREADIFVFPTYYPMEGHPWVIVEAMAAGLPIITTDHGCITESVVDGENGFIIPKKDPDAIAEKVIHLIENPQQRRKMAQRSRELYESSFTETHFVQRMIEAVNRTVDTQ